MRTGGKLLVFLRPMRGKIARASLLSIAVAGIWMFWPLVYGRVIDKVVPSVPGQQPDFAYFVEGIPWLMAAMVLVPLGHYLLWCFLTIAVGVLGQRFVFDLRHRLYRHLMRLSMRFFHEHTTGEVMTRLLNDVGAIQLLVGPQVIQLAVDAVYLVGGVTMMAWMEARMLVVPLVVLPTYFLNYRLFRKRLRATTQHFREFSDFFMGHVTERIGGAELVRSFGKETEEYATFVEHQEEDLDRYFQSQKVSFRFSAISALLSGFGSAAVYLVGCAFVLQGQLTLGEVVAYCAYAAWILGPVVRLSSLFGQIQVTMVSAERVFEYLDTQPETADMPDAFALKEMRGDVSFRNVTFAYKPDRPVLQDVSLDVTAGSTVALVGHTGCGKTTMASLLLRFYPVEQGSITVDGHDLRAVRIRSFLRHVGVVPQDPVIFSGTVGENIAYGFPHADAVAVREAARHAQIDAFIRNLPDGYETRVGADGLKLSTGQKQQLAIARALLLQPAILVLDEATASLDSHAEALIQKALARAMQGRTSFVIAHRLSTIMKADLIVAMENGRIAERGSHEELIAREGGLYRGLYEEQVRKARSAHRIAW